MTQISRRSVARGAAWSVPAVAVASSAPALAASPVTPACNDDGCAAPYWTSMGSMSYSVTGGLNIDPDSDTSIAINYGQNGPSNAGGSVSLLFNDGIGQTSAPRAWIVLADGTMRSGQATLGGTGTWVSPWGVNSSTTWKFNDAGNTQGNGQLDGATIYAPAALLWTDVYGKLRRCAVLYQFTLPSTGAYSSASQFLAFPPQYTLLSSCASSCGMVITSASNAVGAGDTVTLKGSGFTGATTVTFNGVAGTNLTVVNDATMTYTQPSAPGLPAVYYKVEVTNGSCKASIQAAHA